MVAASAAVSKPEVHFLLHPVAVQRWYEFRILGDVATVRFVDRNCCQSEEKLGREAARQKYHGLLRSGWEKW